MCTYVVAKKAVIVFKISVFFCGVSSNPGVSMSVTVLPSRVNSSASWISVVHDPKFILTRRFEPLARLINWKQGVSPRLLSPNVPRLQTFSRFQLRPPLCGNDQDVTPTGDWALGYVRDPDG